MGRISPAARRVAAAAGVICGGASIVALLAACGSGPGPAAAPSTATSGTSAPPASSAPASTAPASPMAKAQCPTSALTATVASTEGGAAAGSAYVPIDFTNISSASCVMYGYPGVSWVTGMRGSQIGLAAVREPGYAPVTVTLAAGGHAHAWLQVADAGNYSPSACHPLTAHWLRVYPPDQYTSLYPSYTAQVCSGTSLGSSRPLSVYPVRAGDAIRGHVP